MLEWLRSRADVGIVAWGFSATLAAFVGFILSLVVPATVAMSGAGFVLTLSIVIFLIVGLFSYALLTDRSVKFQSPTVFKCFDAGGQSTLLTTEVDWLGQSSLCSVYSTDGDLEILIGFGAVLTKQQNKKVQIGIIRFVEGTQGRWEAIKKNEGSALKALMLKPGLPREAVDGGL